MSKGLVLITGGTSGIGKAFAEYFAGEGYDLIITGKREEKNPFALEEMKSFYGVGIDLIYADFRNDEDIILVESLISSREVDILINNAGYGTGKLFRNSELSDLEGLIKVQVTTPVRLIYAALPNMMRRNNGTIINLSSLSSLIPVPRDPVYSSTKTFNNILLESLHMDLSEKGIKLQVLCPGFVRSNFHNRPEISGSDIRRRSLLGWMEPEEVVRISVRNLRRKNKVVVVPGIMNKMALALYHLLPGPVYYKIASNYFT
jgi:hypothetical protein